MQTSYPPGHVPPRPIPQPQPLNVVTIGRGAEACITASNWEHAA